MKRVLPIAMMVLISFFTGTSALAQNNPLAADVAKEISFYPSDVFMLPFAPADQKGMLWDNGPFVTHPGGGPGGSDYSQLENPPNTTFGFGVQLSAGNRLADDFEVPAGGWEVESIIVFAYQTGSTTTSTITAVNMRIWDGEPGTAGATVIWGDETTNIMTDTYWSNCYRGSDLVNTTRPIMTNVCPTTGLSLDEGTYWLDWQIDGSGSSGPWNPPITIPGQYETGNGIQYTTTGGAWAPAMDNGSGLQQGFPFEIWGTGVTLNPPTNLQADVDGQDVHLTWEAPASTTEELIYDDGTTSGAYSYVGYTMSSRMSPASSCKILKLKYYTTFSDPLVTGFEPRVFDWAGTQPGTNILYETTADAVLDDWIEVDISAQNIVVNGDFMAGWGSILDGVYLGYNVIDNGRSWDYDNTNGTWAPWNETYLIRAIVEYTDGTVAELLPVVEPSADRPVSIIKSVHPRNTSVSHSVPPADGQGNRGLLGYNIYRDGTQLNTSTITDLFYDDLDVEPGVYDYTATAVYDEGESAPTDPVTVHVYGVAVDEYGRQAIRVYPNPTSGILNFNGNECITGIEIHTLNGLSVYHNRKIDSSTTRIDISGLANGIYLVKVTTSNEIHTLKITVIH